MSAATLSLNESAALRMVALWTVMVHDADDVDDGCNELLMLMTAYDDAVMSLKA